MHREALTKQGRAVFPKLKNFRDFYLRLDGVSALDVLELGATKAYTIGRRGTFKDYVDLYFVLSKGAADLEEVMNLAEKKYRDHFNSRLFLEQLVYLDDIDDLEIKFLKKPLTKKQAGIFFIKEIKKMKI